MDGPPEDALPDDLPAQPAVFAPDDPEEIKEIAQKPRKQAGLPDEPLGRVANPGNGANPSRRLPRKRSRSHLTPAAAVRAPGARTTETAAPASPASPQARRPGPARS